MANKQYRYKRLALTHNGKSIKAWSKPITLIRKVSNLTCEDCFFDKNTIKGLSSCSIMSKDRQGLPPCASKMGRRSYIFKKIFV
jgi:hypothetical protein